MITRHVLGPRSQDEDDGEEENVAPAGAAEKYIDKKKTRNDDPNFKNAEQLRRQRQEELLRKKNEETLRRLTAKGSGAQGEWSPLLLLLQRVAPTAAVAPVHLFVAFCSGWRPLLLYYSSSSYKISQRLWRPLPLLYQFTFLQNFTASGTHCSCQ